MKIGHRRDYKVHSSNNFFPSCGLRARQSVCHLQDGEPPRHTLSDGGGPGGPQEAVTKVDHLDAVQVLQGLEETRDAGKPTLVLHHKCLRSRENEGATYVSQHSI